MKDKISSFKNDYLGITASVLCLIHCLALPLTTFGLHFSHSHGEHAHGAHEHGLLQTVFQYMDYGFAVLALYALWGALRGSVKPPVKVLLISGWLLFLIGIFTHGWHFIGYFGSFLLIAGHSLNIFMFRKSCTRTVCAAPGKS